MLKKILIGGTIICLSLIFTNNPSAKEELSDKYKIELPTLDELIDKEGKEIERDNKIKEIEKAKEEKKRKKRKQFSTTSRGTFRSVPRTGTSMKSYMSYKTITDKSSEQYKLQHCKDVYTDSEGFRRIGDNFIVAIGTYFGCNVGQEVEVELDNGSKFSAIVGDIKANKHTDKENLQHSVDGSVVEFLVDSNKIEDMVRKMGDCSYSSTHSFLQGNVISITILNSKE